MRGSSIGVIGAIATAAACGHTAGVPAPAVPRELPPPPAWMKDEQALFQYIRGALVTSGFPEVAEVPVVVTEKFQPLFYSYQVETGSVSSNALPADAAGLRAILDASARIVGGGRIVFSAGFDDPVDMLESLRVWALTAGAHELCHHVQLSRRTATAGSVYEMELECHGFEVAILEWSIARGDAPGSWWDLYRRFMEVGLAMVPRRATTEVPDDPGARRAWFDATIWPAFSHSWLTSGGIAGFVDYEAVDAATILHNQHRLDVLDDPDHADLAELNRRMVPARGAP